MFIDATFLHEGLPLSSYVTQLLAEAIDQQSNVLVVTTHPSRVSRSGTTHRGRRAGIPMVVIESGPPGAASQQVKTRIGRSLRAVVTAYLPDYVHVIGDPALLDLDVIREATPKSTITKTALHDGPEPHLLVQIPEAEDLRIGFPMRARVHIGPREPGSPRLGALASHVPHPDAWTELREAFALLDRTDFDFLVTGDTSTRALGLWPCAGLVRPLPLRDLADLDSFFQAIDVLLWPAIAADAPGYAVTQAARRELPVIVVGTSNIPEVSRTLYSQVLGGEPALISSGLEALLDTLHEESADSLPVGQASTTDVDAVVAVLQARRGS